VCAASEIIHYLPHQSASAVVTAMESLRTQQQGSCHLPTAVSLNLKHFPSWHAVEQRNSRFRHRCRRFYHPRHPRRHRPHAIAYKIRRVYDILNYQSLPEKFPASSIF